MGSRNCGKIFLTLAKNDETNYFIAVIPFFTVHEKGSAYG